MRARGPLMGIVAGTLCVVALVVWYVRSPLGFWVDSWLDLKKFERESKKNLNPAELQQWATSLLSCYGPNYQRWERYDGTNIQSSTHFPAGLKNIGCFSDIIYIVIDTQRGDVSISSAPWEPFLRVGAPSLAAPTNSTFIQWKLGIYFVAE